MYLVRMYNDVNPITINDTTTSASDRVMGEVTQGINTINSFIFSIYPNNVGYHQIHQFKTNITVFNEKTGLYEFRGRVLLVENKMDSGGLIYKRVTCESDLGLLHDSYTRYKKYENVTVTQFLQDILDHYNQQVTDDKRFMLGHVEFTDVIQREVAYISTWECLKTRLFDNSNLGGELIVRYENGNRYLDYVKKIGTTITDSPIQVAVNMISLTNEDDFSHLCTRLIPLGAKLENSEERITIKEVNNGLDFIDDADGIDKYGIIEKVVTWDNVHDPRILLQRGEDYIAHDNNILRKFSINAVDLSLLGLNPSSYTVGNYYTVSNRLMLIEESLRVVEKKFSIESPESATLTFGSLFDNIQDYQKNAVQNSIEAKELVSTVSTRVETNNNEISALSTRVDYHQTEINNTSTLLTSHNTDISTLKKDVSDLKVSLSTTDSNVHSIEVKMNRLTKRMMMEVF